MQTSPTKPFRLRSFVRRDGRRTPAQERAHAKLWPQFGLSVNNGLIDYELAFGRNAPRLLEIGFGSGQSLLAAAKMYPDKDFIGVETHKPGLGALFLGIEQQGLTNLRVYYHDVIDVLEECIPDASLHGIQLFFPDPWPKRRHHPRRLIQPPFVALLASKLILGGTLHLATDWENYAQHMMRILSQAEPFINLAGLNQFADRSPYRPVISKFEQRALRAGRHIWELKLAKI